MKDTPGSRRDVEASAGRQPVAIRAIVLVGFMGAGKTSVGRALSKRLGWPFEDLDDRVERREGRRIADIFREAGEAEFRRAEHDALREALAEASAGGSRILAVGGGAFVQLENAALLDRAETPTVFLHAPVKELWRRCSGDAVDRPLGRRESEFRQLYEARRPKYLLARLRVETGGRKIEAIVNEVVKGLGLEHIQGGEKLK